VHSKPVGSGAQAYRYLARYVYRVALSERSILRHDPHQITLRYRDSDTNRPRTLRLEPHEFLRRFLQHVLPSRFCKVRHYGLHHSSKRETIHLLQASMALACGCSLPPHEQSDCQSSAPECPKCQSVMIFEARRPAGGAINPALHVRGPP
jgi:hypothetical protein